MLLLRLLLLRRLRLLLLLLLCQGADYLGGMEPQHAVELLSACCIEFAGGVHLPGCRTCMRAGSAAAPSDSAAGPHIGAGTLLLLLVLALEGACRPSSACCVENVYPGRLGS
jgi:hypothetical protein